MMPPVILLSMLMILLSTLKAIRHLESALSSKLESDLWDTMDWCRKWPVDFNGGNTELVLFDWSSNTGATDVKIDESVLEEK